MLLLNAIMVPHKTSLVPVAIGSILAVHAIAETSSPRLISKVEPECTQQAQRVGVDGAVLLSVEIHEDGTARNITVVRSLGYGLDEAATEAIQKWKFKPGTKDGEPTKAKAQIQISFRCSG